MIVLLYYITKHITNDIIKVPSINKTTKNNEIDEEIKDKLSSTAPTPMISHNNFLVNSPKPELLSISKKTSNSLSGIFDESINSFPSKVFNNSKLLSNSIKTTKLAKIDKNLPPYPSNITPKFVGKSLLANSTSEDEQMKNTVLMILSHELKTPLNGLIGMLALLSETNLDETQRSYLETSLRSAESLSALVNDMFDMQSLIKNNLALNPEPFPILDLLRSIEYEYADIMKNRDLNFICSFPKNSSLWKNRYLMLDTTRLQQILIALLSNAYKYNRENGNVKFLVFCAGIVKHSHARVGIKSNFTHIPTFTMGSASLTIRESKKPIIDRVASISLKNSVSINPLVDLSLEKLVTSSESFCQSILGNINVKNSRIFLNSGAEYLNNNALSSFSDNVTAEFKKSEKMRTVNLIEDINSFASSEIITSSASDSPDFSESSPEYFKVKHKLRSKSLSKVIIPTISTAIYKESENNSLHLPSILSNHSPVSKSILGRLMNTDDIMTVRSVRKPEISPSNQSPSDQSKYNKQPLSPTIHKRNSATQVLPPVNFSPRLSAQQQRLLLTTPKTHLKFPPTAYMSKSNTPVPTSKLSSAVIFSSNINSGLIGSSTLLSKPDSLKFLDTLRSVSSDEPSSNIINKFNILPQSAFSKRFEERILDRQIAPFIASNHINPNDLLYSPISTVSNDDTSAIDSRRKSFVRNFLICPKSPILTFTDSSKYFIDKKFSLTPPQIKYESDVWGPSASAPKIVSSNKFPFTRVSEKVDCENNTLYAQMKFTIIDNGCGIKPEHLKNLFNMFSRSDNSLSRSTDGAGIGLALCSRLASLMDGRLEIQSQYGFGTSCSLHVDIPLSEDFVSEYDESNYSPTENKSSYSPSEYKKFNSPESAKTNFSEVSPSLTPFSRSAPSADFPLQFTNAFQFSTLSSPYMMSASPPLEFSGSSKLSPEKFRVARTFRILVAEDNIVNSKFVIALLMKIGHTVELAENGQEAVDLYEYSWRNPSNPKFDICLMDISMPVMDGFVATATIRDLEKKHNRIKMPIIACTAHSEAECADNIKISGIDSFCGKPIKKSDLTNKMNQFVVNINI